MVAATEIRAWQPAVPGIHEVLHARFTEHAYPSHTHDAWALLIVDDGVIAYGLDRAEHTATGGLVTLLPPDVPHDGRSAQPGGFRKRVLYLDRTLLGEPLIGPAVDQPGRHDAALRGWIDQLHRALEPAAELLEAETMLSLIADRLLGHLRQAHAVAGEVATRPALAPQLRELIDARLPQGVTLAEAAQLLDAHPTQLVRAFKREYRIPPHRYLTGRRVDLARGHLLAGMPLADAATEAGFYDQSHLTRHFKKLLGVSPSRFAHGTA